MPRGSSRARRAIPDLLARKETQVPREESALLVLQAPPERQARFQVPLVHRVIQEPMERPGQPGLLVRKATRERQDPLVRPAPLDRKVTQVRFPARPAQREIQERTAQPGPPAPKETRVTRAKPGPPAQKVIPERPALPAQPEMQAQPAPLVLRETPETPAQPGQPAPRVMLAPQAQPARTAR